MPERPRSYLGAQAAGAREYDPALARRVVAALRGHVGPRNATSTEDLSHYLGIPARTVRAVIADLDGVDFLIANAGDRRLFLCETADEAAETTNKLRARARSELERVRRREAYAGQIGRRQTVMALGAPGADEA